MQFVRKRWPWLLVSSAVIVVLGGLWLARPALEGWNHPPIAAREDASRALSEALAAAAPTRAAAALAAAREIMDRAHHEEARQRVRLSFRSDYRVAAAGFDSATVLLIRTTGESRRVAADRATEVKTILSQADSLVRQIEEAARDVPLTREVSSRLERARTDLRTARLLSGRGRHEEAMPVVKAGAAAAERALEALLGAYARLQDPGNVAAWRAWRQETIAWSKKTGRAAIVVDKESNRMTLYRAGRAVATYAVDLGKRAGPKERAGDAATPEGRYRITAKKDRGQSKYYKALLLDYPNADDQARFARLRRQGALPAGARLGRNIEIHGEGGRRADWTLGCVALSNSHMDEVFAKVEVGTPVTILGSEGNGRMTELLRKLQPQVGRAGR